jgi:dephospho-CoA kinase
MENEQLIIGITGTLGSGKGTVVEYLKTKYNFKHYSASGFITEEIECRGLEKTRENMRIVANDLREKFEPSYVIEQLYKKAENGFAETGNAYSVLESIRSVGEVKFLRAQPHKFYLLAVDADPTVRYNRIVKRGSSKDNVTCEKFLEDEQNEMNDSKPSGMQITECMKLADGLIMNDANFEHLQTEVDKIIAPLLIK